MNEPRESNSRISQRVQCEVFFGISPFVQGMNLGRAKFRPIKTCNLSRTGIGFFSREQIRDPEIAIVMGTRSLTPIFVRAKVVHCTPSAYGGEKGFIVGCHLVERLLGPESDVDGNQLGLDFSWLESHAIVDDYLDMPTSPAS